MSASRTARLELRVTPAQKALIARGAADRGMTLTEYALGTLISAAVRDVSSADATAGRLGWMRGTGLIAADLAQSTEPSGWEPGGWPT